MTSRSRQLHLVVDAVIAGAIALWGLFTESALYVAIGLPMTVLCVAFYRMDRLERQIAELREGRTESR